MNSEIFSTGTFYNEDCFDVMTTIPDQSINLILVDLPYGTTIQKNKQNLPTQWDIPLDFELLWTQYRRIISKNGSIVLTASQPFTSKVVFSNIEWFKYNLVWKKSRISGHLSAKYRPLSEHEDICVFSPAGVAMNSNPPALYNPQNLTPITPKKRGDRKKVSATVRTIQKGKGYQTQTGYPRSIIEINSETNGFHPTQKPVALFEYLIKTYTNEGMTILDNTAGSGTTAIAAINTNRKWICIEKEKEYYDKAIDRIQKHSPIVTLPIESEEDFFKFP